MQRKVFATVFSFLYVTVGILADDDIKRGTFQFLGFIYYQDEAVVDDTGARFFQCGVLIRPNFLISSTLISSISSEPLSKTLLARLGAIRVDANFTFNEDEYEQEQEIIEIITPHQHNQSHWWATDITLLKTLQPFTKTSFVHSTQLSTKTDYSEKICNILIFKKRSSTSEERFLTHLAVEMLPPSREKCGEHFDERTMTCAADPQVEVNPEKTPGSDFCHGNSGGPLICQQDVMALQTYIKGNCNPPHLYQLLLPWRTFLSCGTEDKCDNQRKCPDVCFVTSKDSPPITEETSTSTVTDTDATTKDSRRKEVDVPKSDEVDIPKSDEVDVPKSGEFYEPKSGEGDVPKSNEVNVPKSYEVDVPKSDEVNVPKSNEVDVPKSGEEDVPKSGEFYAPKSGEGDVPKSGEGDVPKSGEEDVPKSGEFYAPKSGEDVPKSGEFYAPKSGEGDVPKSGEGDVPKSGEEDRSAEEMPTRCTSTESSAWTKEATTTIPVTFEVSRDESVQAKDEKNSSRPWPSEGDPRKTGDDITEEDEKIEEANDRRIEAQQDNMYTNLRVRQVKGIGNADKAHVILIYSILFAWFTFF